jgi:hypothetical protein
MKHKSLNQNGFAHIVPALAIALTIFLTVAAFTAVRLSNQRSSIAGNGSSGNEQITDDSLSLDNNQIGPAQNLEEQPTASVPDVAEVQDDNFTPPSQEEIASAEAAQPSSASNTATTPSSTTTQKPISESGTAGSPGEDTSWITRPTREEHCKRDKTVNGYPIDVYEVWLASDDHYVLWNGQISQKSGTPYKDGHAPYHGKYRDVLPFKDNVLYLRCSSLQDIMYSVKDTHKQFEFAHLSVAPPPGQDYFVNNKSN